MGVSFKCGICEEYRRFEDVIRVYDTPKELRLIEWPCWCWQCDDVSLAEYVPEPGEVASEARAWRARDRKRDFYIACGPYGYREKEREPETMEYYDAVLEWRLGRRSRSRCLFCESTMVSLAASLYGQFEHPWCGGMIQTYISIFFGIRQMPLATYSSEGIKLSERMVIA